MAKIAVIIADEFEDSEYTEPVNAFIKARHEVVHIGLTENAIVVGKKKGTKVTVDKSLQEANANDFAALLIPGGHSPAKLRTHAEAIKFVKNFMDNNKPVFSICHGVQLLITAQAIKGRKVTGWMSLAQEIKDAGAEYLDQEVVIDNNLISSRHPGDLPAFIAAALKKL
jgi:protease I